MSEAPVWITCRVCKGRGEYRHWRSVQTGTYESESRQDKHESPCEVCAERGGWHASPESASMRRHQKANP